MLSTPPFRRVAGFVLSLALSACGSPAEPSTPPATASSGSPPAAAASGAVAPAQAATTPLDAARAVAIARGSGFGCALRANGRVACWGSNTGGELGQGHSDPVEGAREVVGLDDAVAIAAAQRVGCAVRRTGGVVCWGSARAGELGDARETSSGGRLVPIPGVEGADAVFAWLTRVCARTRSGMWCWGSIDSRVDGAALAGQRSAPPHRIPIEDVDHLRLGGRSYAFLREGGALTWDYRDGPTALPDVVEALSMSGSELRVLASGEVTLTTTGSAPAVTSTLPALASVHTLAANSYVYFGLRSDGSLAVQGRYRETPVVDGATDLAALAPGEGTLTALARDGRVLEFQATDSTGRRYVPRVIELPPSDSAAPPPPAEGPIPAWCEVELSVVRPELVGSVHAACVQLPAFTDEPCPAGESETRRVLCEPLSVNAPSCVDGGPIWVLGDTSEVALVWSAAAGQHLLRELAPVNAGTEDVSTIERAEFRSVTPLEALLEVSTAEEACDGEGEDELCGQSENGRGFVLLRELGDGNVLRVDVRVDRYAMNAARGRLGAAPRVTLAAAEVTVEACGGRATRTLPRAVQPPAASATPAVSVPASVPTPADVERAAARCSAGWTRFGAGDLQAARTELEAALTQLAGVADDRGRRALGACRYNLGRVEEAEGRIDAARQLYRLSLEVRPNPAVEARLTSLAGR